MFDSTMRDEFTGRIRSLRPDTQRRWGAMNVHQMVCHLGDQLRITLGEIKTTHTPGPLSFPLLKLAVIYVLPWPKGKIKAPPEAFTTRPEEFNRDVTVLLELLERFATRSSQKEWPQHPFFGAMTGRLWDKLTRRHFDHHLTQFGV
jgi:hypothetical protein